MTDTENIERTSSAKRRRVESDSTKVENKNSANADSGNTTKMTTSPAANTGNSITDTWLNGLNSMKIVAKLHELPGYKSAEENGGTEHVPKFLCTHHGGFHCDEALALAMLTILPEFQGLPLLRTRDPAVIEKSYIVVDVGGKYDAETRRFDHHMGDFVTTYWGKPVDQSVTKLSSAGLVFKHYGGQIFQEMAKAIPYSVWEGSSEANPVPEETMSKFLEKMYRGFIMEVDAIDNGVEASKELKYRVTTGLGSRIKRCNPPWQKENVSSNEENEAFRKAVNLCATEFHEQCNSMMGAWYPARHLVESSLDRALKGENNNGAARTMVLPQCCPWQEHLLDIEESRGMEEDKKMLYVIFKDSRSGSYRIQAVPVVRGSFENRKPLPQPWRGVRDAELSGIAGIENCVFCHAGGFIGGNQTLEGALEMAKKAEAF